MVKDLIAIDVGSRMGIAVFRRRKLTETRTFLYPKQKQKMVAYLAALIEVAGVRHVVMEEPGKAVFPRKGEELRVTLKRARDLGKLDAAVSYLKDVLEMHGATVRLRTPVRGGTKWKRSMWDRLFPAWEGKRVSEHARDAAVMGRLEFS